MGVLSPRVQVFVCCPQGAGVCVLPPRVQVFVCCPQGAGVCVLPPGCRCLCAAPQGAGVCVLPPRMLCMSVCLSVCLIFFSLPWQLQVIVIPCGISASMTTEDRSNLIDRCHQFIDEVNAAGIRCRGDFKDNYSPGWKFNHWELKVC